MRRTHRLPARLIHRISVFVCFAIILSGLTIVPLQSSNGKGSISFTQGRGQPNNRKAKRVNPVPPRPGAPEVSLPNLTEVRQRQAEAPEARPPIPSTARSKRKPLESRRGRKVGDPLPPIRRASRNETGDGSERVIASADKRGYVGTARSHHARTTRSLPQAVSTDVNGSQLLAALNLSRTDHSEFDWLRYPVFDLLRSSTIQFDSASAILDSPKAYWPLAAINFKYGGFDFLAPPLPQSGTSKIVFTSNRDGSTQIYVMNSDGSGQTRLTYNSANDDNPRWSPNGAKILFQSDRDNPSTGYMDIYVMNPDGSGQTRLTSDANDDGAPVWSPDGSKIAFHSARNGVSYQVYVMNADGSGQVNVSTNAANDTQPSWSPDGAKIAFASDRDQAGYSSIYVMNANGNNQTRLTFSGSGFRDEQPSWSPDGMKLAFTTTRDSVVETWQETDEEGGIVTKSELHVNKEIYVMNAEGTNQIRLTNDLSNDDSSSWSPDGAKVIFRSDRERECCDPTAQVWMMNPDGSNQIGLSNNEFGDYSASWIGIDSSASQLADNSPTGNQPPVANAGGSHVGLPGQAVQFNGSGSFDPDGTIVTYSWSFGDGTSGTGPNPTHQYNADGAYSVWLSVADNSGNWTSSAGFVTVGSVSLPVRLTFDELPNNTTFNDQFQPYLNQYGVRFSSANFFYPVHTYQNCGLTCSATSLPNFISTKPDDTGQVIVTFTQPVSNLVFYAIGVDTLSGTFAWVDVYRNGSPTPSNIFPLNGVFGTTVGFTSGSLDNISKVVIRGIIDPAGIGFDDFSFSVPSDIKITNARVSGYLNGTTQNGLLGADIALNATPLPGGFSGGTYTWTFTGPFEPKTGINSSSVTIRSTDVGTITATVSYTGNGLTATGSVTINSVLPTVTSFTAQQTSDTIAAPGGCGDGFGWWWYRLGCSAQQLNGIQFSTNVHAPTFISDPSQSGIKYVQAISTFRKRVSRGLRCSTIRSAETNVGSGWQLDTSDPYDLAHYFSEANDLTMTAVDSPGSALTNISSYQFVDSAYVDDQFEMYVVYFTVNSLGVKRPLSRLPWNWGGLVVFDSNGHHIRYTNASPITRIGEATNSMVTMQGNVEEIQGRDFPCPGGPALTDNHIDSSRVLVKYYYSDILARGPDGSGWDGWTSTIAQCVFDLNCIVTKRSDTALGFFFSAEFIQNIGQEDPVMANPPGSPNFNAAAYNPRFVYWCYKKFLGREPDQSSWDAWTNILNSNGDYGQIVYGFIYSTEYRNRSFF